MRFRCSVPVRPKGTSHRILATPVEPPQTTTMWDFETCDRSYGLPYPGRLPGQVALNLLRMYTAVDDLVIDAFAGSGTVHDACAATSRRCLSFDLRPTRSFIARHDAARRFPLCDAVAKLVIIDPPYWDMLRGKYTDSAEDLSRVGLKRFMAVMEDLAAECSRMLVRNGFAAVILSSKHNPRDGFVDIPFMAYEIFRSRLAPEERISLPYRHATSHTPFWSENCLVQGTLLRGFRDVIVFRNDEPHTFPNNLKK